VLDGQDFANFLNGVQRRLNPLGWFSIIVLLASGMLQMSANPNYEGFLAIRGLWGGAILVKHILFGIMVAINGYYTWGTMPKMQRAALLQARGKDDNGEIHSLQRQSTLFMQINIILGIIVLLLTAVARSV